jgi:hypothetical protein
MKNALFIIGLLLIFACPAYSDNSKFCNDPPHWEHFNSMVADDPENIPLQILHALKIGLCIKIDQNSISTQEAIGLFTDMLNTLIDKVDEAEKQEDEQKPKKF